MSWYFTFWLVSMVALLAANLMLVWANEKLRKANRNLHDALTSAIRHLEIQEILAKARQVE